MSKDNFIAKFGALCGKFAHKMRSDFSIICALIDDAEARVTLGESDFADAKDACKDALEMISVFSCLGHLESGSGSGLEDAKHQKIRCLDVLPSSSICRDPNDLISKYIIEEPSLSIASLLPEADRTIRCRFLDTTLGSALVMLRKYHQCLDGDTQHQDKNARLYLGFVSSGEEVVLKVRVRSEEPRSRGLLKNGAETGCSQPRVSRDGEVFLLGAELLLASNGFGLEFC